MREGFAADRLTFARVDGGRLQIGSSALAVMRQYVQDAPEKAEAGGILLGRHILGTNDIIVDNVTVPMPGDRRSRFQFFRARRRHQEAINRAWHDPLFLSRFNANFGLAPLVGVNSVGATSSSIRMA